MISKTFFSKRISFIQMLFFCVFWCLITYFSFTLYFENQITLDATSVETSNEKVNMLRDEKGYKYTKPLFSVDIINESPNLNPIKEQLTKLINEKCKAGNLVNASIFIKNMNTGEWATINKNTEYQLGSLPKVPVLIYYLKESQRNPTILEKKLELKEKLADVPVEDSPINSIQENKSYTIRQLLKYMVSYSDKNATALLMQYADSNGVKKVFTDLGLKEPSFRESYMSTAKNYSLFMRILYSATYLTPENSDFALSLLSESSFNQGLSKALPTDLPIAHKFGKSKHGNEIEMHESGIIYCGKNPYIITVMTNGNNESNQVTTISQVSDMLYHFFCS